MDAADVLPHVHGIIVHDCRGSYWKYQDVTHAICCAHLLRELNGVIENYPEQTWAVRFKELLLDMKKVHDKELLSGKDEVSCYHRHKFDMEYDSIMCPAEGSGNEISSLCAEGGSVDRGRTAGRSDRLY